MQPLRTSFHFPSLLPGSTAFPTEKAFLSKLRRVGAVMLTGGAEIPVVPGAERQIPALVAQAACTPDPGTETSHLPCGAQPSGPYRKGLGGTLQGINLWDGWRV